MGFHYPLCFISQLLSGVKQGVLGKDLSVLKALVLVPAVALYIASLVS